MATFPQFVGLHPRRLHGLERLTKPCNLVEAHEGAAEDDEGEMDVVPTFVSHGQAAQAGHPGMCAFD